MQLFVGTSGYSYKPWKGIFYPEKLPDKKMLSYYAEHFNTVEINNTFYRMPKQSVIESWNKEVPGEFRFVIKAPKLITHIKKMEPGDSLKYFIDTCSTLKEHFGALLFQFPPYFKKDTEKLKAFSDAISTKIKAAFEFRHDSWFSDDVYDVLKEKNFALCLSDTDEKPLDKIIPTADWVYLRLRRLKYTPKALKEWKKKISAYNSEDAFVFFKHEDEAKGPKFAEQFQKI